MRQPIPTFVLPLLEGDAEPSVDLGAVLHALYDRARFDLRLDYTQPPVPPLVGDLAVVEAGIRELSLGEIVRIDADGRPIAGTRQEAVVKGARLEARRHGGKHQEISVPLCLRVSTPGVSQPVHDFRHGLSGGSEDLTVSKERRSSGLRDGAPFWADSPDLRKNATGESAEHCSPVAR